MIGAIFIMGSFCVIGIVLGLLDGGHYIKEKNIKNKTLQNARKKSFFRILRILIETMTWTMLLYIGAVYGKYMDTWIKLIVAVILGMFPIVMLFPINNKS